VPPVRGKSERSDPKIGSSPPAFSLAEGFSAMFGV
jgi:hypothetical protein